jgi:hypothetical protein
MEAHAQGVRPHPRSFTCRNSNPRLSPSSRQFVHLSWLPKLRQFRLIRVCLGKFAVACRHPDPILVGSRFLKRGRERHDSVDF